MAALTSVEYRCSDLRWCYLQQTVHFFQSDTNAVIPNKLAFTNLHCSISSYILKGLRSNKPSHKHDSNKYLSKQSICNLRPQIRPDQICDARKQNIPGLIDVLIAIYSVLPASHQSQAQIVFVQAIHLEAQKLTFIS